MTREQVFQRAEERFSSAISYAQSAGNRDLRLLATAGRARARLNQGDLSGAASDAEQIPEGFVWYAEYSFVDGGRENRLYDPNRRNRVLSADPEAYGNLELDGPPDPRVPSRTPGSSAMTRSRRTGSRRSMTTPMPTSPWPHGRKHS